jgi:hypothetical protein
VLGLANEANKANFQALSLHPTIKWNGRIHISQPPVTPLQHPFSAKQTPATPRHISNPPQSPCLEQKDAQEQGKGAITPSLVRTCP